MKLFSLRLHNLMVLSLAFASSLAAKRVEPPTQQSVRPYNYDVTLVGFVNSGDGIGRHPILFKKCLKDTAIMNFVSTRAIPAAIEDAQLNLPRLDPSRPEDIGAISILTDILGDKEVNPYTRVPNSFIKVAYTMFEATQIPQNWASILNQKFDMAVVPDQFLVDVYRNCGVHIPIFVLPLPLILQDFLDIRAKATPHKPFTFGMTGGFWKRKNHMKVLKAFAAEFGNRRDVKLRLHGRFGEQAHINALVKKIQKYKLSNVELIVKPYTHDEYVSFFQSLDCYVFLSMGEGFSITPREALAASKPCILSDNTAHLTICQTGAVRVVPSTIPVPAFYDCHNDAGDSTNYGLPYLKDICSVINYDAFNKTLTQDDLACVWRGIVGEQFDCSTSDAQAAMRDVFDNYKAYLAKAKQGKQWVTQYSRKNMKKRYITLVKPQTVVLGDHNSLGDDGVLVTNCPTLYAKYQCLLGNQWPAPQP